MNGMTTERPTKPGWYWVRERGEPNPRPTYASYDPDFHPDDRPDDSLWIDDGLMAVDELHPDTEWASIPDPRHHWIVPVEELKASGLDAIEHEDGWVLMTKAAAKTLRRPIYMDPPDPAAECRRCGEECPHCNAYTGDGD